MKSVVINNKEYEIVRNDDDVFDLDSVKEKITDYFDDFDYILGDQAYNKIRLKGFYDSTNKKKTQINDIKQLDSYISNYCAYGCKVFLLKKVK